MDRSIEFSKTVHNLSKEYLERAENTATSCSNEIMEKVKRFIKMTNDINYDMDRVVVEIQDYLENYFKVYLDDGTNINFEENYNLKVLKSLSNKLKIIRKCVNGEILNLSKDITNLLTRRPLSLKTLKDSLFSYSKNNTDHKNDLLLMLSSIILYIGRKNECIFNILVSILDYSEDRGSSFMLKYNKHIDNLKEQGSAGIFPVRECIPQESKKSNKELESRERLNYKKLDLELWEDYNIELPYSEEENKHLFVENEILFERFLSLESEKIKRAKSQLLEIQKLQEIISLRIKEQSENTTHILTETTSGHSLVEDSLNFLKNYSVKRTNMEVIYKYLSVLLYIMTFFLLFLHSVKS